MRTIKISILVMVVLTVALGASDFGDRKFELGLGVGGFRSSDAQFAEVYARVLFMPRLFMEFGLGSRLGVWGDLCYVAKTGMLDELSEELKVRRWQAGMGLFYRFVLTESARLGLGAGLVWHFYKESGLEMESSGQAVGLKLRASFDRRVSKKLFLRLDAGYSLVNKKVEGLSLKLGGLELTGGVGYRF